MSENSIPMPVPHDSEGFIRQECPACGKQFKSLPGSDSNTTETSAKYYCPYCGQSADGNSWMTKEQREYAMQLVSSEVVDPILSDFSRSLNKLNRHGSMLSIKASYKEHSKPSPLIEPNDMKKVVPSCHPDVPIKILEDWNEQAYCLICGKHIS